MQKIRKNTPKLRDINTLLAQHIFLYNCNDVNQIVAEINQSLISLYTDHQTTSDGQKIQHMIDILEMCSYKIQITELAQQLHMSEKTLGRLVYRHMGVPPKTLLRIFKFQNAHKHLVQHGFTSMISAAFSGGYFDQPHFNREYKKFTGTFPTDETLSILYNTSQAEHI